MPFITTFNEFLTVVVMRLHMDVILVDSVVPTLVKFVAVVLSPFGISASVSQTTLYLAHGGIPLSIFINWNCVGWQSLILFLLTLFTGLHGSYTGRSKLQCVIIGLLGIFWLNIFRIALVCIIAFYFGLQPAIIFHDYGGIILILLYLWGFWYFATGHVLEPMEVEESTLPIEGREE
jgi:exosortase/archaeosortase family protein